MALARFELRRGEVVLSGLRGGQRGGLVLLLHGLAGSAQEMAPTASALLDDHRVIALDQRGHGHSTRRPADLSRSAFVDDVVAVIEALAAGISDGVTVVGQSMGAHTAMLVAAARPDLVRGLVMLEGGVGGSDDDYPARLGEWFRAWPVPFADERAAIDFLGGTPMAVAWAGDLVAREGGLWPRFDADVMEAVIRGVAATARWDDWASVTAPTLLVRGDRGNVDAGEWDRMIELRPGVGRAVIADAGHDAHVDQPAAWQAILRDFLGA